MVEIEKYPCNDANEACAKERYWFERLNSTLNMKSPHRSEEEFKQYKITHRKNDYEKSKERIWLKRREVIICQCGQQTTYHYKPKHLRTIHHLQYMNTVMSATASTIPIIELQSNTECRTDIQILILAVDGPQPDETPR